MYRAVLSLYQRLFSKIRDEIGPTCSVLTVNNCLRYLVVVHNKLLRAVCRPIIIEFDLCGVVKRRNHSRAIANCESKGGYNNKGLYSLEKP